MISDVYDGRLVLAVERENMALAGRLWSFW